MTTAYILRRIETGTQAEALPVGTIAIFPAHGAAIRVDYGLGWSVTGDPDSDCHEHLVGCTALIPTTAIHDLANELSNSGDRGWLSPIGDELLELLAGINNR